jgi:hypothetical protein
MNNLKIIQNVRQQNEDEKTMIEEDLVASNRSKMELIYQREEIEQYIEKTKNENPDLQFITASLIPMGDNPSSPRWEQLMQALVFEKQRALLLDLIRELH